MTPSYQIKMTIVRNATQDVPLHKKDATYLPVFIALVVTLKSIKSITFHTSANVAGLFGLSLGSCQILKVVEYNASYICYNDKMRRTPTMSI